MLWKWLGARIVTIGYIGQTKKDVLVTCTIFAHIEMTFAVTENGNKRTILRSESMSDEVKKIYDYVSKMEERHLNKLTGGENVEVDMMNIAAMTAYGMTRWFIEDMSNNG